MEVPIKEVCRDIIRNDFSISDPKMPEFLELLSKHGADECWHKCGTFKEHLFHIWRICKIWNQSDAICRLGLFHSAYSNSYVNLAIFRRDVDRQHLKQLLGEEAEELIYTFCVIPRHQLIFNIILGTGEIPKNGVTVKNILDGSDIHLSEKIIACFAILTVADFGDQRYGWQDLLYGNENAKMTWNNDADPGALWPGDGKPGLWVSWASHLTKIVKDANVTGVVLPPIFNNCLETLSEENELKARDLYWKVITEYTPSDKAEKARELLHECVSLNPYVGEPHVLLAQIYIQKKRNLKVQLNMGKKHWSCYKYGGPLGTKGCHGKDGLLGLGLSYSMQTLKLGLKPVMLLLVLG